MKCQKDKFQLQGKVSYLNCAYMSPMMKKVEKAGRKGIKKKRKPYQVGPDDFFADGDRVRDLFAQLINVHDPKRVAIIPSVSYGLANVVHNLPRKRGKVILVEEQFPSNVYPWMNVQGYEVKIVSAPDSEDRGPAWSQAILDAMDSNTVAISLGHVHWADGTRFDLEAIRQESKKHGAAFIVDGTQSVGALPFDCQTFEPDALICAGYKWLMGPYSIGLAYYGEMFDAGQPVEENWINRLGAEDFGGLVKYEEKYMGGALRYEVGEHSNFILLPMLIAALKEIIRWTPESIQTYCAELTKGPLDHLRELGYWIAESSSRGHHLFGIRIPDSMEMESVKKQIGAHRVNVSYRGSAIRVSPHVYNEPRDIQRLVRALSAARAE